MDVVVLGVLVVLTIGTFAWLELCFALRGS